MDVKVFVYLKSLMKGTENLIKMSRIASCSFLFSKKPHAMQVISKGYAYDQKIKNSDVRMKEVCKPKSQKPKEDVQTKNNSLAHTKWNRKHHKI